MTAPIETYEEAFERHKHFQELEAKLKELAKSGPASPEAQEIEEALRNCVKPGIYEHFKSTPDKPMHHVVFWVARVIDDGPFFVDYAALYLPHVGEPKLRALLSPVGETDPKKCDGFLDPIDRLAYRGPRFKLLEEHTVEELLEIASEARKRLKPSYT